jgi:hypothetical protein
VLVERVERVERESGESGEREWREWREWRDTGYGREREREAQAICSAGQSRAAHQVCYGLERRRHCEQAAAKLLGDQRRVELETDAHSHWVLKFKPPTAGCVRRSCSEGASWLDCVVS